jgi:hypothetical protein
MHGRKCKDEAPGFVAATPARDSHEFSAVLTAIETLDFPDGGLYLRRTSHSAVCLLSPWTRPPHPRFEAVVG